MSIGMRKDLARQGLRVPAGLSYSNYDTLEDVIYLTADDLKGADGEDDEDSDDHPFWKIRLANQMVVYMYGVDLDVNEDNMRYELMKTPDGYMVYDTITSEYVCDGGGDNLFDSYSYAEDLMNTYNNEEVKP